MARSGCPAGTRSSTLMLRTGCSDRRGGLSCHHPCPRHAHGSLKPVGLPVFQRPDSRGQAHPPKRTAPATIARTAARACTRSAANLGRQPGQSMPGLRGMPGADPDKSLPWALPPIHAILPPKHRSRAERTRSDTGNTLTPGPPSRGLRPASFGPPCDEQEPTGPTAQGGPSASPGEGRTSLPRYFVRTAMYAARSASGLAALPSGLTAARA